MVALPDLDADHGGVLVIASTSPWLGAPWYGSPNTNELRRWIMHHSSFPQIAAGSKTRREAGPPSGHRPRTPRFQPNGGGGIHTMTSGRKSTITDTAATALRPHRLYPHYTYRSAFHPLSLIPAHHSHPTTAREVPDSLSAPTLLLHPALPPPGRSHLNSCGALPPSRSPRRAPPQCAR